jgi:hypothetical protein
MPLRTLIVAFTWLVAASSIGSTQQLVRNTDRPGSDYSNLEVGGIPDQMPYALHEGPALSGLDLRQARHSRAARPLLVEGPGAASGIQPMLHIRHRSRPSKRFASVRYTW